MSDHLCGLNFCFYAVFQKFSFMIQWRSYYIATYFSETFFKSWVSKHPVVNFCSYAVFDKALAPNKLLIPWESVGICDSYWFSCQQKAVNLHLFGASFLDCDSICETSIYQQLTRNMGSTYKMNEDSLYAHRMTWQFLEYGQQYLALINIFLLIQSVAWSP